MRRIVLSLLLASSPGWTAAEIPAAPEELTPETIFGGDLEGTAPSRFLWSPDASRLAFLQPETPGGPGLLHVLELGSGTRSRVVLPDGSGGEPEIAPAAWAPDGSALLAGVGGDLYLLPVPRARREEAPRRLTSTPDGEKDPKFSPDGSRIGFVRDHELYVLDLKTGGERPITAVRLEGVLNGEPDWVYEEELDLETGWWWSPDSSRVAYLQLDARQVPVHPIVDFLPIHPRVTWQRYPKAGDDNARARVGVVEIAAGEGAAPPPTRWMDLGPEPDVYAARVAWSASGARLAVQRLDRSQTALDLLLFDPATGRGRAIHQERDPRWINIANDCRFLPAGAPGLASEGFLWGSERDGFRHLYLHGEEGRIRRLTSGAWAVTELREVDAKGGWAYFEATERGPLERHLYRVRLDGTGFSRLTQEDGWHETRPAPDGSSFVDVHSTASSPPRTSVRRRDGTPIATLDEGLGPSLRRYRRGRVTFLTIAAPDRTPLPAMMTLPPDFDPARRYPALVYVYGGPRAQVVRDTWTGGRGLWHQMMAARGVIVWSLDNRGAGARGRAWEEPILGNMGSREMADQLAGVEHLRSLPYVDPARIGVWGWSYGGYMTLYLLTKAPGVFRAGAAVAPVVDWRDYDTLYTERYMRRPAENAAGYDASAPLKAAASLAAPLLLVHGSADDNVHLQNSIQLLDALVKAGRPVEFMLYPGQGHGITEKKSRVHLYEKLARFLQDNL